MIDSYAKVPSSLLLGNILWMGDYDECRNVSSRGNLSINVPFIKTEIPAEFNGQYCRATFINKTGIVGPIIGSNLKAGLNYGLCLPSSCDEKSMQPLIHLSKLFVLMNIFFFFYFFETIMRSRFFERSFENIEQNIG